MKILFIHDYPFSEGGGIETQIYMDALFLSKRGHQVTIATTRTSSETYQSKKKQTHKDLQLVVIKSEKNLKKLICENEIVSIQATFSLRDGMMNALKILTTLKKKYIVVLRTTLRHIPFSRIARLDEKELFLQDFSNYLKSDLCLIQTVSNCFDETLQFLGVNKKYTVIHNGKDWNSFITKSNKPIQNVDITYIGEISWMKGIHTLLAIVPLVLRKYKNVKFRIIGNGQDKQQFLSVLESVLTKKEMRRVLIIDYIENKKIYNYLSKTKIIFIPSLTESWCNVAMEALGSGAYVVASHVEGLIELSQESKNCFLFEQGDIVGAFDTIKKVIHLRKLKPEKKIQNKYSINKKIGKLESFYRHFLLT